MRITELFEGEVINFAKARERLKQKPEPVTHDHVPFVVLEKRTPEWERAWGRLKRAEEANGYDIVIPDGEEQWQYMGTQYVTEAQKNEAEPYFYLTFPDSIKGEGYYHSFRIRWHPVEHRRIYRSVGASPGWKPSYQEVLNAKILDDNMKAAVRQLGDIIGKPPKK